MGSIAFLLAACAADDDARDSTPTAPIDSAQPTTNQPSLLVAFVDQDEDGFGVEGTTIAAEYLSPGLALQAGDCDDADPERHPDASEICDEVDQDCDGQVDEDVDFSTWFTDADADGWGDEPVTGCIQPDGTSEVDGDCDDTDVEVHPGAPEVCNDWVDNDCAGDGDRHCRIEGTQPLSDQSGTITGWQEGGRFGERITCCGDVDGDGVQEALLGEDEALVEEGAGRAWLIDPLAAVHGPVTTGTSIQGGTGSRDWAASSLGFLPDQQGDGRDEVYIGDIEAGRLYIFFGRIWDDVTGSNADLHFSGPSWSSASFGWSTAYLPDYGVAVAGPGNMYDSSQGWGQSVGTVWLFDAPVYWSEDIDDASAVIQPRMSHTDGVLGAEMCSDDLDGDGISDLLISATSYSGSESPGWLAYGVVYLFLGPVSGTMTTADDYDNIADADGRLDGEYGLKSTGYAVACSGDTDGDGALEMLVGAPFADPGYAFLVDEVPSGVVAITSAATRIEGPTWDEGGFGQYVADDIDADGDGFDEVLVGSSSTDAITLFYGPVSGSLTAADADATLEAEAEGDWPGAVVGAGDLDGDGFGDFLVGAPYESSAADRAGAVYLVFGGAD